MLNNQSVILYKNGFFVFSTISKSNKNEQKVVHFLCDDILTVWSIMHHQAEGDNVIF